MLRHLVATLVALAVASCPAVAQAKELAQPAEPSAPATPTTGAPDPTAHLYVFGLGLGLGVGGAISWKYRTTWTGDFTTLNEGWFGRDTYAGGADKLGHFYTDYVLVRALRRIYAGHGYDDASAIRNALVASATIRTVMEVADGYTTFKFSPQDLIANMAGSLTSAFLLSHPRLDELLSMSWTYMPSREKLDGKVDWFSIDNDYNGSVYHLDLHLKALAEEGSALRRYTVGLSYATRGYDRPREDKQRLLGVEVGLDLEDVATVLRYYKLPFTFGGATYDLDHHRWGGKFGLSYFY